MHEFNNLTYPHHEFKSKEPLCRRGDDANSTAEIDGVVYRFPNAELAAQAHHAWATLVEVTDKLNKTGRELQALSQRSRFAIVK